MVVALLSTSPHFDDLVIVVEQTLAGAENQRVDHQEELVDEVVRQQGPDQLGASHHHENCPAEFA